MDQLFLGINGFMRRRRSEPWIYRWSRVIIAAIAILGAILTAYLTITKLTGGTVTCSAEQLGSAAGCNSVLDSPYAFIFGLPLSLYGFLAYVGMTTFALAPLKINPEENKQLRNKLEEWTWLLLLVGGASMAVFSSYLMYTLAFKIQTVCYYCIGSAIFSWSLLVLSIIGHEWEDLGQIFFTGITAGIVTIVATLGIYAPIDNPQQAKGPIIIPEATTAPQPPIGWEITTDSGAAEIALAKHLTAIGAKKYGAFWCPHCYEQKQLFGEKAFKEINYIECDPQGKSPQTQSCIDVGIKSYPTWEIKGQLYPGTKSLQKLAELSGYTGSDNFKYFRPGL